ncbi:unnamed protein product [Gongylonema pulchrum]|uniref:DNA helicase n=1 Tax=Gongylonema pulchrum TaxID=637853 RepID=A0A183DFX6_9BILA|nr:unnamed protein product [Gongylonema pulchrum]
MMRRMDQSVRYLSPNATAFENALIFSMKNEQRFSNKLKKMLTKSNFQEAFESFRICCNHPFRVTSSEKFRDDQNNQGDKFKYSYIVSHCVHFRDQRIKGFSASKCIYHEH